jgi:hypothetical protein
MAEEEVAEVTPQSEETGTEELTEEEQLWEDAEDGETETSNEPEEPEEEDDDDQEEPEQEDDQSHDYEKRYKDLEKEFHKRNEDSARQREQFQELRVQNLEMQRQMDEFSKGPVKEPKKQPPTPGSEEFFDEDDRQTMDEFSELTKTFTKIAQAEVAKAGKGTDVSQKIETLERSVKDREYQDFLVQHESHMINNVGENFRDLDRDSDFQSFVLASPAMTKMMTESVDARDHASVMNLYLQTDEGKGWRTEPDAEPTERAKPQRKESRRRAASSLVKNSAPRMTKNPDSMSAEELWDSIPDD